jgi:chromosomal replication initiation ATPase DnaA
MGLHASKEKEDVVNIIDNKSAWGRVRNKLLESYGINLDKHWFSKLTAFEDDETKQLSLKAPSNFIREWVNAKYFSCIKRACIDYGWSLEGMISV